jgi:hypothetical protein
MCHLGGLRSGYALPGFWFMGLVAGHFPIPPDVPLVRLFQSNPFNPLRWILCEPCRGICGHGSGSKNNGDQQLKPGYMNTTERIRQEIEDLREQILSLDEEIWINVQHRDAEALKDFIPRKEKINERLLMFQKAAADLLASMEDLPDLQIQVPEALEMIPSETVAPLERKFAFHKPSALQIDGEKIGPTKSWRKLWQTFLDEFQKRFPQEFKRVLVDQPCIAGLGSDPAGQLDPYQCAGMWFECNLSAESIRDRIRRILINSRIDLGRVKVWLRGAPDLEGTIFDQDRLGQIPAEK